MSIALTNNTRKLQIVLAGAVATNQLPVTASFSDAASTAYQTIRASGGSQLSNTNGATAVDIVSAPRAGYIRTVTDISVRNNDTAVATVTIRYNDNGTLYKIIQTDLAVSDQLFYTESAGWVVLDLNGNVKSSPVPINSGAITKPIRYPAVGPIKNNPLGEANENTPTP